MKLRMFAVVAAVCVTMVACDNASKESNNVIEPEDLSIEEVDDLTEISDEELEMFADMNEKFQQINFEAQGEMMGAVEATGLDLQRYTEIQQMSQMPDMGIEATDEEMDQFAKANNSIEDIQDRLQGEMITILEEAGLSEQWFENVLTKLQSNEALLNKYQQMISERLGDQ